MVELNNAGTKISGLGMIPFQLSFGRILAVVGGAFAVTYLLFQKKLLPLPVAKVVSKILFLPTFPITAMMRIGNYWTEVDDTLILGCAPFSIFNHPDSLKKLGVKGVVNMCYEYNGPTKDYARLGIKQLHLPTVDHTEPAVETLIDAVAFIQQHKERGERVYVHCKAGHGRAASVALSWLLHQHRDKSPKDLNMFLRQKRFVRTKLYQQRNIENFHKHLETKK